MKVFKLFVIAVGLALTTAGYGESVLTSPGTLIAPVFLPVDEAFELSVHSFDQSIEVRWLIAPGYYLYRQKLGFELNAPHGAPEMKCGEIVQDDYFGKMEVYHGELVVSIPLPAGIPPGKRLLVSFQGCAEAGLCYTPQKREFSL